MSYSDERDKLAELFGVKNPARKSGYSEELKQSDAPPQESPFPTDPVSPESPGISIPVKLRPPSDIATDPHDTPAVSLSGDGAAGTREKGARALPTIEDEEFIQPDYGVIPDFSDLDFLSLDSTTPGPGGPGPAVSLTPPPPGETPRLRVEAPAPPSEVPAASEMPAAPPLNRPRATINRADLHFESDAALVQSENDHFLLETRGLVKIYDGRTVVNGVDINVRPGEIVGLLGPNGAGKTTSFYMIVGLVPPNGGQVLFNGNDVTNLPMYQRARLGMGYLPQEESIFRKLTVEENIMAVMETLDLSRKERHERCQELLERFSITHIRKNVALTCSGGEKRRLTIARSLVTMPSLLMLDEPFSGVDPIAVNEIQNIVEDLRKSGLAILITDHNARQTLELVDRAYLIYEGKVLREGTRDFLINDPVSRELYLGDRFTM
jgi:lipopolysaccharide export system ATP-binding protein